ncbi:hypothetical protein [Streptomyces aureus]|uniref:hypothetical protein n=1 Tax=Streptomyces aureus TaxID=193461 RepID=UPI000B18DCA8|nr:hypothetical protein [Streptomyces aureus]
MPQANGHSVFVKAIPTHDPLAAMYRTEGAINRSLPQGPGPRLLAELDEDGWIVLAFEYVDGRHPDLTPGSPDLPHILDAVIALHAPSPRAPTWTCRSSPTTRSSSGRRTTTRR